jgi:hypothetical protein
MTTINISYKGLTVAYEVIFNTPIGSLKVGDSIFFSVKNEASGIDEEKEFLVVHKGRPSNLYNTTCNGVWLLMKDCCLETKFSDNANNNNYYNSKPYNYLNNFSDLLVDQNIKDAIKTVDIPYFSGGNSEEISSLPVKCFLLGGYEVGLTTALDNSPLLVDGAKLDYFIGDVAGNSTRAATYNGNEAY